MEVKKQRESWLDLLRGFALLSIVYGHASRNEGLMATIVYTYHVPLCVFLTGYLYHFRREERFPEVLKKNGFRLLLPYLIWSFISIGIYMLMGTVAAGALDMESYSLKDNLIFLCMGLSIGNAPLWYLPFLFCVNLLLYSWLRLFSEHRPGKDWQKALAVLGPFLFSVLSMVLFHRRILPYFPFGLGNACMLLIFPWAGYLLSQKNQLPEGKKWLLPGLLLAGVFISCGILFNEEPEYMAFTESYYGDHYLVFLATALGACISFCWLGKNLGKCRLLQWFGRNAMAIFLMHKFPVLFFQVLLGDAAEALGRFQFLFHLFNTFASVILCCLVGGFLRRFLPWILGEKGKK